VELPLDEVGSVDWFDLSWTVRLYKTTGSREAETPICLYIAVERDWPSKAMERSGHHSWNELARAKATPDAAIYREEGHRARCLRYSGKKKQGPRGLAEDLAALGYDRATIRKFLRAARPFWPKRNRSNGGAVVPGGGNE